MLTSGVCLLHDNAHHHTARLAVELLDGFGWNVLIHPPRSPDSTYFYCAVLKLVKNAEWEFFKKKTHMMVSRNEKCMERDNDYFEK